MKAGQNNKIWSAKDFRSYPGLIAILNTKVEGRYFKGEKIARNKEGINN